MYYKLKINIEARTDLDRISEYMEEYDLNKNNFIEKIDKDIKNLRTMPRIHKTLISHKNPNGEYRRIVSGKYIIIYQIIEEQINILRVFHKKEDYLNLKNFILKEKSKKYLIIK